ncbi:hypothetical protein R5W23_002042 [Gemmata sp. JC673]|uniref:DUF1583 domain-containing protein n=1 Tax=Gemmata algarum TaxID=2975278 RepID=A0ABU5EZQ5_9BACT|nr:hypothetical protein [Gemmata algarum]MDY3560796.1 hypothetical protein [Gemmata algarum]
MQLFRFVLCLTLTAGATAARADTFEDATRQRETKFASVSFEFEVVDFVPKGMLGGKKELSRDAQTTARCKLILDGPRARYENNQPLWSASTGEFLNSPSVLVTDGHSSKLFFPKGISGSSAPRAIVGGANAEGFRSSVLTPLMMHCRGLSPALAPYVVTDFKRTEGSLTLGEHKCREYLRPGADGVTISVFVDDDAAVVGRRLRKLKNGNLVYQLDTQYEMSSAGLAPASWKLTEYDDSGKLKLRREVKVLNFSYRSSVDVGEFQIDFPSGTQVFDQMTRKHFIAQGHEVMRETDAFGTDLGVEVVQPDASWWRRYRSLVVWAVFGVGILCCTIFWVRRRRGRRVAL